MRSWFLAKPTRRFYLLLLGIYLAGVLLILWRPETSAGAYSSSCLFRNATGIPCPGCGMGRGVVHSFHFDLLQAFQSHPIAIPASILILVLPVWVLFDLTTGNFTLHRSLTQIDLFFLRQRWAFWVLMGLLILLWAFNIYKFQHHAL